MRGSKIATVPCVSEHFARHDGGVALPPCRRIDRQNGVGSLSPGKAERHDDKAKPVVSLSGPPIYHHAEPAPFSAPQGEAFIGEISDHIERHLGPIDKVFHEIVSDTVHIGVHVVLPNDCFDGIRLVTSGMSDLPMTVPDGSTNPRYAELMISLPADWKLDQASFEDEAWYWPVRLLKSLARLPHKHATWLVFGHTVPNGDPDEPYASGVSFTGALVVPPVTTPSEFAELSIPGVKDIQFFAVVPLHREEMQMKLCKGTDALLARFGKHGISDAVRLDRKNVARRRFSI